MSSPEQGNHGGIAPTNVIDMSLPGQGNHGGLPPQRKKMRKGTEIQKKKSPSEDKRSLAKIGMALSLGALVYTGFRGQESRTLHITSGLALVGFSFWHYSLYQPQKR
jgi:hypothetical protein